MITTAEFAKAAGWGGILTLVLAALTVLAFVLQWGIRFRLVGATGFMGVLTSGLFALSLVPIMRTSIPGAVRYTVVYDNGANQAVVAVAPEITETELEATLRQAASDLFSLGRYGGQDNQFMIRARTIIHPAEGLSKPLFLGQVKRSLAVREDENMQVELFHQNFAELPSDRA